MTDNAKKPKLSTLDINIKPQGWMLNQMEQLNNLQKRLSMPVKDFFGADWEFDDNFPKYARGLVMLAQSLNDPHLSVKATKIVTSIMNSANEGGGFGKRTQDLTVAKIEAVRAVFNFYNWTNDSDALLFLKKFYKNLYVTYDLSPCVFNARARLIELLPPLTYLMSLDNSSWLKIVGDKLIADTNDWLKLCEKYPYKKSWEKYISQNALKKLKKQFDDGSNERIKLADKKACDLEWNKSVHKTYTELNAINVAKAVKYPIFVGNYIDDQSIYDKSIAFLSEITKHHANALGALNCDELLNDNSNDSTSDVEAIIEFFEAICEIIKATANNECCDLAEQLLFNFMPLLLSDDAKFVKNENSINGILHNSAFHKVQGKSAIALLRAYSPFINSSVQCDNNELKFLLYAPCTITSTINGHPFVIHEETGYPFRNSVNFKVAEAYGQTEVKLTFRVPKGATMQIISGGKVVASGKKTICVKSLLKKGSTFMLKLDIPLLASENSDGTISLYKGNVMLSEKILAQSNVNAEKSNMIYSAMEEWNFAPALTYTKKGNNKSLVYSGITKVNDFETLTYSFENPPFEIIINSKEVINWKTKDNPIKIPASPIYAKSSTVRTYLPLGAAKLSLVCFPECSSYEREKK